MHRGDCPGSNLSGVVGGSETVAYKADDTIQQGASQALIGLSAEAESQWHFVFIFRLSDTCLCQIDRGAKL